MDRPAAGRISEWTGLDPSACIGVSLFRHEIAGYKGHRLVTERRLHLQCGISAASFMYEFMNENKFYEFVHEFTYELVHELKCKYSKYELIMYASSFMNKDNMAIRVLQIWRSGCSRSRSRADPRRLPAKATAARALGQALPPIRVVPRAPVPASPVSGRPAAGD